MMKTALIVTTYNWPEALRCCLASVLRQSTLPDEVVIADLDLSLIEEVRNVWQFYRDRRPETYDQLTAL